ncbi:Synaptosomal-associated protein 25, partial [Fragariocoptes setiger]
MSTSVDTNPAATSGGLSELEYLKFKASKTADDSLEATRRMRELCEESDQVGIATLRNLDEQGSKLNRVEEDLDKIGNDMRRAERNLKKMKKWFTPFSMCMGPRRNKTKDKEIPAQENGVEESSERSVPKKASKLLGTLNGNAQNHGATPVNRVTRITGDDREDEMEENLEAVGSILGNLKEMAITMGNEITTQNSQLDRINVKAQTNMVRIGAATDKASKI